MTPSPDPKKRGRQKGEFCPGQAKHGGRGGGLLLPTMTKQKKMTYAIYNLERHELRGYTLGGVSGRRKTNDSGGRSIMCNMYD